MHSAVEKSEGRAAKKLNLVGFWAHREAAYSLIERAREGCWASGTICTPGAVRERMVCEMAVALIRSRLAGANQEGVGKPEGSPPFARRAMMFYRQFENHSGRCKSHTFNIDGRKKMVVNIDFHEITLSWHFGD